MHTLHFSWFMFFSKLSVCVKMYKPRILLPLIVCFISLSRTSAVWSASINSLLQSRSLVTDVIFEQDKKMLLHSIAAGAQLALEHCQREFMWERWNCPDLVFSRRGRQTPTKETAFVSAITAAAIIYTVTRNCSRGQIPGCMCDKTSRINNHHGNSSFVVTCPENLSYAEKVVQIFLESLEGENRDAQTVVTLHNNLIGRNAVRKSFKQVCKCQGILTRMCSIKTCDMKLEPFAEIASLIKEYYEYAVKVDWLNSVTNELELILPEDNLVYITSSPDYCKPNIISGWLGTVGRTCSLSRGPDVSQSEKRSCTELCRSCGYQVKQKLHTVTWHCKCTFEWCCRVACSQCSKVVEEQFCE